MRLVNSDITRIRFIQFHSSYQYEDFIEGFVPLEGGGFRLVPKHLMEMCDVAEKANGEPCVLIIDELSRSDPARVFGEALTYIERNKRGLLFHLASGKPFSIPPNLIFLATMNPMDKGVDDVDAALERRFAKIAMNPDVNLLRQGLEETELSDDLRERTIKFFNYVQNKKEMYRIGHAYFYNVRDEAGLRRLWENQLYFYFKKAFGLNEEGFQDIERHWQRIFAAQQSSPSS
jgi:5-methylcytosine-specific restriction protein B